MAAGRHNSLTYASLRAAFESEGLGPGLAWPLTSGQQELEQPEHLDKQESLTLKVPVLSYQLFILSHPFRHGFFLSWFGKPRLTHNSRGSIWNLALL
jgi:hypothetical protein